MQAALYAAMYVACAAVQVQMVLAQLSKKTRSWFAAGARYGPGGEGRVVWVAWGGLTPRKQVEHRAPIGEMPPHLAKVVLDLAIFDRSVGVCGELGVPAHLRKIIVKEYRLPADRYSELAHKGRKLSRWMTPPTAISAIASFHVQSSLAISYNRLEYVYNSQRPCP